jgi:hypothetical protein
LVLTARKVLFQQAVATAVIGLGRQVQADQAVAAQDTTIVQVHVRLELGYKDKDIRVATAITAAALRKIYLRNQVFVYMVVEVEAEPAKKDLNVNLGELKSRAETEWPTG